MEVDPRIAAGSAVDEAASAVVQEESHADEGPAGVVGDDEVGRPVAVEVAEDARAGEGGARRRVDADVVLDDEAAVAGAAEHAGQRDVEVGIAVTVEVRALFGNGRG